MIIYTDILTGDEIISDVFDITEVKGTGGLLWEANGAMVTQGGDNFVLEGANASAEGEDADEGGDESGTTQVLNFQRDFRYQKLDSGPDKAAFSGELKKYLKKVMKKMEELGKPKEEIDDFKKNAPAAMKVILADVKDYDFYLGEGAEPDGEGSSMYVVVNFREDGMTPFIRVWKHGLNQMKV